MIESTEKNTIVSNPKSKIQNPKSKILPLILLGGFLLRLVFFTASLPSGGAPFIRDEGNYIGIAIPLSQGFGFVDKWAWLRPPGYPAFLAAFLALPGGSLSLAALAQIILSVLTIGILYALTLEVFTMRADVPLGKARAVALVAAGLLAVNPHVVFYSHLFMPETLYMLALSVIAWALLRGLRAWNPTPEAPISRSALALIILSGLTAAAGVLLRSLLLSFTPLLLAWFWWALPRSRHLRGRSALARRWSIKALAPLALFVVVMFAAILPWTIRNYLRYDRFLLVDTMAGYNLWQYNDNVGLEEVHRRLLAIPNPVDREKYASEQGVRAIMADPLQFAQTAAERFADAWPVDQYGEFRAFFKDKYPGTDCANLDIFAWLGTTFYVGLGLLAIWGFLLAPGRTFKGLVLLILLHYAATTMVAHAEFRYRMPLYPFVSVYAGWAFVGIAEWVSVRRRSVWKGGMRQKRVAVAGAAILSALFVAQCLVLMLPGLPNSIKYERRYLAGKSQMEKGDYAGALDNFMGAAQIDRSCACLYRNIGLAQGKLGQPNKERAAYTTAITREEHDWRTRALLSDRLRAAGDPRAANPVSLTRPEFHNEQERWAWEHLDPPKQPAIDVGGADIGYIMDFQSPETEPDPQGGTISYRWTKGHSYLRLPVPSGGGKLSLTLRWRSLAWPGKPNPDAQVRVLINGREAATVTVHPGWEDAALEVKANGSDKVDVVELLTSIERPPGGETRQLGVAVDSVRFERK